MRKFIFMHKYFRFNDCGKAFTLAEVLITLGIIGVVAAMTLPSLVQNYKEKATVTRVKKAYSVLANAFKMAEYENGEIPSWFTSDNKQTNVQKVFEYIEPYLKISKICGFDTGCVTKGYIKDGTSNYNDYDANNAEYKFITADGMNMWIYSEVNDETSAQACAEGTAMCGNIKVDIDGFNGDYTFGKDVFIFYLYKNGVFPSGRPSDTGIHNDFIKYCNKSSGFACAAWVIYNENMDYLHCDNLSWNEKTSCK